MDNRKSCMIHWFALTNHIILSYTHFFAHGLSAKGKVSNLAWTSNLHPKCLRQRSGCLTLNPAGYCFCPLAFFSRVRDGDASIDFNGGSSGHTHQGGKSPEATFAKEAAFRRTVELLHWTHQDGHLGWRMLKGKHLAVITLEKWTDGPRDGCAQE